MVKKIKVDWPKLVISCILVYAVGFPIFMLSSKSHINESLNNYQNVEPIKVIEAKDLAIGGTKDISAIYDKDPETVWEGHSTRKKSTGFTVFFPSQKKINKIFVNFSSWYPVNFTVEAHTADGWTNVATIRNNSEYYYLDYLDFESDQLRFEFYETAVGSDLVVDAFFYEKVPVNTVEAIFNLFFNYSPSLGATFFYVIFFILSILSGGHLLFRPFKKYFRSNILLYSFGCGFIFWFLVSFFTSILHLDTHRTILMGLLVPILLLGLWSLLRNRKEIISEIDQQKTIYLVSFLFIVFLTFWAFLFEDQYYGSQVVYGLYYNNSFLYQKFGKYLTDQMLPFITIKMLLYGVDQLVGGWPKNVLLGNVLGRPQFFPYSFLYFFRIFGDNFFIFQSLVIASLSMLVFSIYTFLKKIFSRKIASLSIILLVINYYFLYIFELTQIKLIATFFIFISYYLLAEYKNDKKSRYLFLSGVFGALAVLTHNFMMLYIFTGVFFLMPNPKDWVKNYRSIIYFLVIPLVAFVSWLVSAKLNGGIALFNTVITGSGGFGGPNPNIIFHPVSKLFDFFYPYYLNFLALFEIDPYPELWGRAPYGLWRVTLIGAIGIALVPFVLLGLLKQIRRLDLIIGLIFIPLVLALFSSSFPTLFGVHLYLIVSLVIMIALAATILSRWNWLIYITIVACVLERIFVSFFFFPTDISAGLTKITAADPISGFLLLLGLVLPIIAIIFLLMHHSRKPVSGELEEVNSKNALTQPRHERL